MRITNMFKLTLTFICLGIFICTASAKQSKLKGKVAIDGSSTVFPITEAVAEDFRKEFPRVRINIGVSGTGGGFKKFTLGEIDINNASRHIKSSEIIKAKKNNIKYLEIPVAYDGITIVINKKNNWATTMTTDELKLLWDSGSKIRTWKEIRSSWPDRNIKLYGPGTDSGTFDYFTKSINGKSGRCRSDFTKSEDDNVLVRGVAGDLDALGFFGYAYYVENKSSITSVAIDNGNGPVVPSGKTIKDGTYKPLSRPIFIYLNTDSYQRRPVKTFVDFYIKNASTLVKEVGYISLPAAEYNGSQAKLRNL